MQTIEIRFHGTTAPIRATIDAGSKAEAEGIAIRKLAAAPGTRSIDFSITGRTTASERATLPTIDEAIA